MKNLLEHVRGGEILLGDGAWGTMLMARGLKPGKCPENLNLTQPEALQEIAALYLEAGAEFITTNTFGGSPLKLADYSLEDRTEDRPPSGPPASCCCPMGTRRLKPCTTPLSARQAP